MPQAGGIRPVTLWTGTFMITAMSAGCLLGWAPGWHSRLILSPSSQAILAFFFFILAFVYLRIKARPLTAAPRPQEASQLCAACLGSQAEPPAFPPPLSRGTLALFPPPRTQQRPCPFVCSLGPLVGQTGMHLPCFLIFSSITPMSCLSFLPYPQAW